MLLRTQVFEKRQIFPGKKLWRLFFRSIEYDKCHGTSHKGIHAFLTSNVQAIWSFLWDLKSWEPSCSKEGYLLVAKGFGLFFSRIIECDKPPLVNCKGSKAILTITVELIRAFFWTQEVDENTIFWKEAIFQVKKKFTLFFLVVFNMTNNRN